MAGTSMPRNRYSFRSFKFRNHVRKQKLELIAQRKDVICGAASVHIALFNG